MEEIDEKRENIEAWFCYVMVFIFIYEFSKSCTLVILVVPLSLFLEGIEYLHVKTLIKDMMAVC